MKELKDYLHLYKGCQVQVKDKSIVTFCGVSYDETGQYFVHLMSHKFGYYINLIDDIKPILRPLSDMAEKDIYKIVSIMLGKEIEYLKIERSGADFITAEYKNEESEDTRYDRVQMEVHISNIGNNFRIDNIWNYIKGNNTGQTHEPLHNHHEITRWLLSQGFDIYGLIDKGLAINKNTTLKNDEL